MNRGVVIVAGGRGQRMGSEMPKQYMKLLGKPVIIHTLEIFFHFDPHMKVVLVLASDHRKFWNEIPFSDEYGSRIEFAQGGESRYDSVKNGLRLIDDDLVVGIHDAVRPLVSLETLERCYASAAESGSGIPVIEMDESVRMVKGEGHSVPMDRSRLRRVQTPQVFRSAMIKEAYNQPGNAEFTDDAAVYESLFERVRLVAGNRENIKITTPTDLQLASILIRTVK
ncbi:MAG: 2-C-methyl-D-erythritol 4-phosphate cytidylyltransferase [Bacteroidota bacterium]